MSLTPLSGAQDGGPPAFYSTLGRVSLLFPLRYLVLPHIRTPFLGAIGLQHIPYANMVSGLFAQTLRRLDAGSEFGGLAK